MINTRKLNLTIDQIRCIRVKSGEVLFVQVDVGTMPPVRAHTYLSSVQRNLEKIFPKTPILVVPSIIQISAIQP